MNALAPLIRHLAEPSPSLLACFAPPTYRAREPDDAALIIPAPVPVPSQVAEAVRLLAEYERAALPPERQRIRAWVLMLAQRVAITPAPGDIDGRVDGLCDTCAGLPAWVFGTPTLTAASAAFNFFPSVHALHALLSEAAAPFLDTLAGLRRVAGYRPGKTGAAPVSERGEPTEAEREHVRQAAATIRADLDAAHERIHGTRSAGPGRAVPLSDGALLAQYEALTASTDPAVATNARARLAILKRKIEREAVQ